MQQTCIAFKRKPGAGLSAGPRQNETPGQFILLRKR
jgi:hypothetical protein